MASLSTDVSLGAIGTPVNANANAFKRSQNGQPMSAKTSIEDNMVAGQQLRQSFIDGTLTPEGKHALMAKSQLRKGMIGSPVTDDIRNAIASGPYTILRPILLQELQEVESTSRRSSAGGLGVVRDEMSWEKSHAVATPSASDATPVKPATGNSAPSTADAAHSYGDGRPAKKKLKMKRTGHPERPNPPAGFTSALISRAPFTASAPINPVSVSPEIARIFGDIVTPGSTQVSELGLPETGKAQTKTKSLTPTSRNDIPDPAASGSGSESTEGLDGILRARPPGHSSKPLQENHQHPGPTNGRPSMNRSELNSNRGTASSIPTTERRSSNFFSYGAEIIKKILPGTTPSEPKVPERRSSPDTSAMSVETGSLRRRTSTPIYNLKELTHGKRRANGDITNEPKRHKVSSLHESLDATAQELIAYERLPRSHASSDGQNDDSASDVTDDEDWRALQRSPSSKKPKTTTNELTAEGGRPYNKWRLETGEELSTSGALLPTRYKPNAFGEYPWICPVRSCRLMFPELTSLGHHFIRGHRLQDLTDNSDGTLSIISHREEGGASVVSQKPLSLSEDPMVEPSLAPRHLTPKKDPPMKTRMKPIPGVASGSESDRAMSLWKKVHPMLSTTPFSPIPTSGHVPALLPLPKVRDVVFNPRTPKYFERRPQDISALIIQMTGQEASKPCKRCQEGRGPFKGCVVISEDAPAGTRTNITACANCFYKSNQTYCDVRKVIKQAEAEAAGHASSSKPIARPQLSVPSESTNTVNLAPTQTGVITRDTQNGVASSTLSIGRSGTRQFRNRNGANATENTLLGENARSVSKSKREENVLDMEPEEWEIAPGRIRLDDPDSSGNIKNIAFSTTYLSHGEEVVVARDVGFNVLTIKCGTRHRFSSTPNRLRVCSVASGKIRVKMLGKDFNLGPNGMFHVMANTECVVNSIIYGDVTLHVITMPSEFEASA